MHAARRLSLVSLTLFASLLALVATGCPSPTAIGGACDPGAQPQDQHTTTINTLALECEGRTCVQMNGGQAFCSAACAVAEDCQTIGAGGTACRTGFTCAVAVRADRLACRRYCVCRDDGVDPTLSCPAAP